MYTIYPFSNTFILNKYLSHTSKLINIAYFLTFLKEYMEFNLS